MVVVPGVSGSGISGGCVKEESENDMLECMAVARIAFSRRKLFCCLLGVSFALSCTSSASGGVSGRVESASGFLFASVVRDGSVIGQTNPVLGV